LRDRKEDILLLFRKFVVDFAEKYKTAPVQMDEEAKNILINYPFPGNVRELKNLAEQISVLSTSITINGGALKKFLPEKNGNRMPMLASDAVQQSEFSNEREILYKLFFDMKKDVTELKKMFVEILQNPSLAGAAASFAKESLASDFHLDGHEPSSMLSHPKVGHVAPQATYFQSTNGQPVLLKDDDILQHEEIEETLNIMIIEKELIIKALKKHKGKRKDASIELGISERTLYRKLKEYDIDDL
jgi:DNA-binding NtrC family response regulator